MLQLEVFYQLDYKLYFLNCHCTVDGFYSAAELQTKREHEEASLFASWDVFISFIAIKL